MKQNRKNLRKRRGYALVTTFGVMSILAFGGVSYVGNATAVTRQALRQTVEVQTTNLSEAATQAVLRSLWRPFKIEQTFEDMDDTADAAALDAPCATVSGSIEGVGEYTGGVIRYEEPNGDPYTRLVTVRSVGWVDYNDNDQLDENEPRKVVDVTARFQLARSQVFDYTYFVNNYGWMNGFNNNDLIVNGDMRANGNFDFTNGSPTINGSVYASLNEKLTPAAPGLINQAPVKWTNSNANSKWNSGSTLHRERWRQPYSSARHGARGSSLYQRWRDFIFDSDATMDTERPAGAIVADSTGLRGWSRTSSGNTPTYNFLDSTPTEEVVMPDLSNLDYYINLSRNYADPKAVYGSGAANPYYGQEAFIEVWNDDPNGDGDDDDAAYERVTTDGVYEGSLILIGTESKPVRIHGPVTITEDVVIKGTTQGQGTIYTGRNVHIVGSLKYSDKDLAGNTVGTPDFRGSDPDSIDNANENRSMLGLAARGSVIMGDTTAFTSSWPLQYMTPPFTKGRYDENGNWIPPFDAKQVDYTGKMKYQSTIPDADMHAIAEGINQLDAVLYTNFVGGGNVGMGGGGVSFNGSIISKDEAMVVFSLPMRMNYDHRIRERGVSRNPLIDLQLPRSPTMLRSTWQDRGFVYNFEIHYVQ